MSPNSLEENKSRGFVAGGRGPAVSQPGWWPQLLGLSRQEDRSLSSPEHRSGSPQAALAWPQLFASLIVSFGINTVDFSFGVFPGVRVPSRRRERDVLH